MLGGGAGKLAGLRRIFHWRDDLCHARLPRRVTCGPSSRRFLGASSALPRRFLGASSALPRASVVSSEFREAKPRPIPINKVHACARQSTALTEQDPSVEAMETRSLCRLAERQAKPKTSPLPVSSPMDFGVESGGCSEFYNGFYFKKTTDIDWVVIVHFSSLPKLCEKAFSIKEHNFANLNRVGFVLSSNDVDGGNLQRKKSCSIRKK